MHLQPATIPNCIENGLGRLRERARMEGTVTFIYDLSSQAQGNCCCFSENLHMSRDRFRVLDSLVRLCSTTSGVLLHNFEAATSTRWLR